jgi:hypothetical protein
MAESKSVKSADPYLEVAEKVVATQRDLDALLEERAKIEAKADAHRVKLDEVRLELGRSVSQLNPQRAFTTKDGSVITVQFGRNMQNEPLPTIQTFLAPK